MKQTRVPKMCVICSISCLSTVIFSSNQLKKNSQLSLIRKEQRLHHETSHQNFTHAYLMLAQTLSNQYANGLFATLFYRKHSVNSTLIPSVWKLKLSVAV